MHTQEKNRATGQGATLNTRIKPVRMGEFDHRTNDVITHAIRERPPHHFVCCTRHLYDIYAQAIVPISPKNTGITLGACSTTFRRIIMPRGVQLWYTAQIIYHTL